MLFQSINISVLSCILIFGVLLCCVGFFGFFYSRTNLIFFLISNEIFLLGIIFCFVTVSYFYFDISGEIFALIILVVAAVETAIVLILFVVYFRLTEHWSLDLIDAIASN